MRDPIAMAPQFESALCEAVGQWGLVPDADSLAKVWAHFEAILEANKRFNLTRITEPVAAAVKLYADSLSVVAWATRCGTRVKTVLDAGTGAGFPAVPVAVMQPRWQVTAVDSTGKKAAFVSACARELGVRNLLARHARVEELHAPPSYALVLFKAVSKIDVCLRWAQHAVGRGGAVVLYKTPNVTHEEEEAGQRTCGRLGYGEAERFDYVLQCCGETLERTLRVFRRE